MDSNTNHINEAISRPVTSYSILPVWLRGFKVQAIIVAVLALLFYGNTVLNEFAFDDNMVILRNAYVLEGAKGIPDIITKDTYDSYFRQNHSDNVLSGGRYRPLSVVTFALEQQFLGAYTADKADSLAGVAPSFSMESPYEKKLLHDMHIRHAFNVLWFTLSVVVLLYFLRYVVLKNNSFVAFVATILFTIHPIHTEVVANVKSRDELLSLLFICLTFIFAFKYREHKNKAVLGLALGSYVLAFLSKEYAITLVALLPLAFYLFAGDTGRKSLVAALPYWCVATAYLMLRLFVVAPFNSNVDNSLANNSYALASGSQKIATEIATSLTYLKLLMLPHPLSSDYSYNTIPFKDFSSPVVWFSVLVHLLLIGGFFYFLRKKHVLSFAIAVYFLNLLLINNFLFFIGATMGERLIYNSSVGFAIALAYMFYIGLKRITSGSAKRMVFMGGMLVVIVLCAFKTIQRNADWKNNFSLYAHDVKVVPNSFLMNGNMATIYLNKSDAAPDEKTSNDELGRAIVYLNKTLAINPVFTQAYIYRGLSYFKLRRNDSALADLNKVMELSPYYPGLEQMFFNVGVAFYKNKQYEQALAAWQQALKVQPGYAKAQRSIDILYSYNLLPKK